MNKPMTLIPWQSAREAEALAFARERVAELARGDFLELGFPPLHPGVSRAFAQRMIVEAMRNADMMLQVIDAAYLGWRDGRDALDALIMELTNRHQPLPAFLAEYNARRLKGALPARLRGRRKSTNLVQDILACGLIIELIENFKLRPTRSQIGRKREPSACSIVSQAMAGAGLHRGGERAMQDIWRRYEASLLTPRAEAVLAEIEKP
jgi:hypothetical protein